MNNCDACNAGVKHSHGRSPRIFTFGLDYGDSLEEIDVQATDYEHAKQMALAIARQDYEPGWKLIDMDPGGTGGLIQVWR